MRLTTDPREPLDDACERLHALMAAAGIPAHMHDGLALYLVHRIAPGHFLTAVIENDLAEAVKRGDDENIAALAHYVRFLYAHAPLGAWGYRGAVAWWRAMHAPGDEP